NTPDVHIRYPSPMDSVSLEFIEALYQSFLRDPESVPSDWQNYFRGLSDGNGSQPKTLGPSFKPWSIFNPPALNGDGVASEEVATALLQERVDLLIRNYRVRGHMAAQIDPL